MWKLGFVELAQIMGIVYKSKLSGIKQMYDLKLYFTFDKITCLQRFTNKANSQI
jgi:hypothetical protein